jgi:hypothetical protein
LLLVGGPISAAGHVVFFVPYRLTDWLATRPQIRRERQSTWKLLGGAVIYLAWIIILALAAGVVFGVRVGVGVAIGLPVLALVTQFVRDRWKDSRTQAHRYLLLQRKGDIRAQLLARRRKLAEALDRLRGEVRGG